MKFDLRKGDGGARSHVVLAGEAAVGLTSMDHEGGLVRFRENQDHQARDREVGLALFREIGATGRFAENLDNHHGPVLPLIPVAVLLADHHRVR